MIPPMFTVVQLSGGGYAIHNRASGNHIRRNGVRVTFEYEEARQEAEKLNTENTMPLTQQSAHRKDVGKIADMQHRHFATIATIIRTLATQHGADKAHTPEEIAAHFAHYLARTNSKFDRERFLRACKP